MADANEEIIGAIGVSVTGDYSSLAASYSSAQDQAEAAGKNIADAFNEGVSGVSDAADVVTEALGGIGPAGDDAASGLNDFGESAGEAGESAETASEKLLEMAEDMQSLGEALIITESLKEFGSEALSAADGITTASIALTQLTGDAGETQETIEGLENLGMSDGLAMPSLLTAATRMTALLPEGTNVVGILGLVANGAAVMGTSIDSAANQFDRMVSQGTASARTLTSLGLSLESLSGALNTVAGSTVSTADDVATMFKSLDDQGRIAVLTQALNNLGGTAQSVAEQTFGGQWQQLANAWEGVMVQVGQAILPVITDLTDFVKLDVAPTIQFIASAFNQLPEPVKEFGAALAVIAAGIIPVTAGVGFLLDGLGRLAPIATTVVEAFGGMAGAETAEAAAATEAAAANTGLAESEVAVAGGATTASLGAGALALSYIGLAVASLQIFNSETNLVGAWKAGAAQQNELNDQNQKLIQSLQNLGIQTSGLVEDFNAAIASGESYGQASDDLNTKSRALIATYMETHTAAGQAAQDNILIAGSIKTTVTAAQDQSTAYTNALGVYNAMTAAVASGNPIYNGAVVNNQDLAVALQKLVSAASAVPGAILPVGVELAAQNLAIQKANASYVEASSAYETLLNAYNQGAPVLGQLNAEYAKQQSALAAVAAAGAPVVGSLQAIDQAANAAVNSTGILATNFGVVADQATAQADALSLDDAQVLILSQKLDLLVTAQDQMAQKVAAGTAQYSQQLDIQKQVVTVSQQLTDAQNQAATAALNQGNAAAIAGGDLGVLKQELDAANLNLQQMTDKADAGTVSITAWAGAQKAAQTAAMNLSVAAAEDAADVGKATDSYDLAAAAAAGAAAKLAFLTQAFKDNKASASDVAGATTAALNAQIAFNQQQAVVQAGLQGTTDSYGLLQVAVVEAQAKVDTLTAAQQNNQNVGDQLAAAIKSLTTAQQAANSAWSAGNPLLQAMNAGETTLGQTVPTVTSAITQQATQLQTLAGSLQSVGAAIQSVESDFQSAIDPTGQYSGNQGGFFVPNAATANSQDFASATAQAQSLMPAKGTSPEALAQDVLAQAQAVLQVDQKYFGVSGTNGPLVTASTLQSAQQAVATAQEALATVQGGSAAGSTQAGASGVQQSYVDTTTASTGTVSSGSTPVVSSTSGAGTSAVDGGSYPAVTAHQATGEIWAVSVGGTATGGAGAVASSISEQIATTVNETSDSSGGLSTAVSAIGGAVQQLATNNGALLPIAASLSTTAAATQQIAVAIGGLVQKINGGGVISSGLPTQTGGSGTAYQSALPTNPDGTPLGYVPTGNPLGTYAPPSSTPIANVPGYNPFGPTSTGAGPTTVNVSVDARGAIGMNTAAMSTQISAVVASTLVGQLRSAGARF